MKRIRKYSLQVAAAAILAVIFTMAAPRAVHAVTAALVNVTNTAASPAIGQSVSQLASQNIYLQGGALPGGIFTLDQEFPDGTHNISVPYVVPAGQNLIVTTIDIVTFTVAGTYSVTLANGIGRPRKVLMVPGIYTAQFQYPSGIVFPAGDSVQVGNDASSPGIVLVYLHGYLTSN